MTTKQQGLNLQTTHLPKKFLDHIKALGDSDAKFFIEKKITKTNLKQRNSRMPMPSSMIHSEFLTKDEKGSLTIKKGKHLLGIDVLLWDPFLNQGTKLCLKKWDYNNNSSSYMLIENWNYVVDKNGLRADLMV
ncbi:hypothetical protein FEM48_Zijuj10G0097300 [Ziziphus jujuba var. spinosa]|uniref:Uncharacterized protein n=1 Tax=Ziziphus jujuba var. spinosa TaxID=714518 RepID=A0A978UMN2_ZIZJJ|nr:hypothetical protein FEM48_Zijuj10G0097300 [Ziziphus jujuba var. spinosa]